MDIKYFANRDFGDETDADLEEPEPDEDYGWVPRNPKPPLSDCEIELELPEEELVLV